MRLMPLSNRLTELNGRMPERHEDLFLIGDVLVDCTQASRQSPSSEEIPLISPGSMSSTSEGKSVQEPYQVLRLIDL